jgi:hypothetical protein
LGLLYAQRVHKSVGVRNWTIVEPHHHK